MIELSQESSVLDIQISKRFDDTCGLICQITMFNPFQKNV